MVRHSAIAFERWGSRRLSLRRDLRGRTPTLSVSSVRSAENVWITSSSSIPLRRVLSSYFQYHHDTRTHLSLGKDCPRPRRVHLPSTGNIIAFPEVGGLHHRY